MTFPGDWQRRAALTVDHTQVAGSLSDFPVVLTADTLPDEMLDADGSAPAQGDGGDIRFTSDKDGTNLLALDVVSFAPTNDPANAEAQLWVKVPALSDSADTTIYVWYRTNATTSQLATTDPHGRNAVWTNGYLGVWLFEALSGDVVDRTGNGLSGAVNGASRGAMGKIGKGYSFDGNATVDVTQSGKLEGMDNLTISMWVNGSQGQKDGAFIGSEKLYEIVYDDGSRTGGNNIWWAVDNGEDWVVNSTSLSYTVGVWHKWDLVSDLSADEIRIHRDGPIGLTNLGTGKINSNGNSIGFGQRPDGGLSGFKGKISLATISDKARSPDWLETEHANQNDPLTFWTVGNVEQTSEPELAIENAIHANTIAPSAFVQVHDFKTSDVAHGHVADITAFGQIHYLDSETAVHQHTAALTSFLQKHDLILADAVHVHVANQANVGTPPDLTITKVNVLAGTEAEIGVSTDTDSGKVYWVVTHIDIAPTVDQIKAGLDESGNAADAAGMKAV